MQHLKDPHSFSYLQYNLVNSDDSNANTDSNTFSESLTNHNQSNKNLKCEVLFNKTA